KQLADTVRGEDIALALPSLADLDQQRSQVTGRRPQTGCGLFGMIAPAAWNSAAVGQVTARSDAVAVCGQRLREVRLLHADRDGQPGPHDLLERVAQLILKCDLGHRVASA